MQALAALSSTRLPNTTVPTLRSLMMELRKCCNHPRLVGPPGTQVEEVPSTPEALEALVGDSGKLALLDEMMRRLRGEGHRVLIYSQFTRTLDLLEDWLEARRLGYCRIDGGCSWVVLVGVLGGEVGVMSGVWVAL
jgi:SNF2 family DNA or RNA helicase